MARADCVAAGGERRAGREEGKRFERIAVHLPGLTVGLRKLSLKQAHEAYENRRPNEVRSVEEHRLDWIWLKS